MRNEELIVRSEKVKKRKDVQEEFISRLDVF